MLNILKKHRAGILFFFLPWGAYFSWVWPKMLFLKEGGLFAGHPYVWADWSMHIALAANFAFRPFSHWFDSLPVFAGAPVTYPFVTNLISGILWRGGFSLPLAFVLPSLLFTYVSLVMLYIFFYSFWKSSLKSALSCWVFLCSGGLGAFLLVYQKGISVLYDSTVSLTQIADLHIEVNTIVASMLIPQRAFLLGLPIGLGILLILIRTFVTKSTTVSKTVLIVAGVLAALLPIIHTHTFIVIAVFSCWIFCSSYKQLYSWLWYGIPATVLSLILMGVFLSPGVSPDSFFSWNVGWVASGSIREWCMFWLKNWGLFLPLALVGTGVLIQQKKYRYLWISCFFWFLFLLGNIVQLQPQEWDNTKLFAWSYLGLTIPVTYVLSSLYQKKHKLFTGAIIAVCVCVLTVSGFLDLVHNLDFERKSFQMLSQSQMELGEYIRKTTSPEAVFATAPIVSNPISMIGGRSVLLGYPGWAFSYGLEYVDRENAITTLFTDPTTSDIEELNVDFVIVGREEERLSPNIEQLENFFTLWYSSPEVRIYKRL